MSNSSQQQQKFEQETSNNKYLNNEQPEAHLEIFPEKEQLQYEDEKNWDLLSEFWLIHAQLSNFNCGFFWGLIVSFIAIASGLTGASLTAISSVRSNFVAKIERNKVILLSNNRSLNLSRISLSSTTQKLNLTPEQNYGDRQLVRRVNLLLIGIEPHSQAIENSPTAFMGDSKTILLLQFQPQKNSLRVINIPPDSRVQIPGLGWGTISDANKYGGTSLVSQTVSQLLDNVVIDGYIRATPKALSALLPRSGKPEFPCSQAAHNSNQTLSYLSQSLTLAKDCTSNTEQIQQQQIWWETIRQRLHEPRISDRLPRTILKINKHIDTNLSAEEILVLANFIGKLESDRLRVSPLPNYSKEQVASKITDSLVNDKSFTKKTTRTSQTILPWQNVRIAVQNTTDDPELSLRVISYLNQKGFDRVYLGEHLPLKLAKTEIILPHSKIKTAERLKLALGIGRLELENGNSSSKKELTIRVGEDAQYLTLENSFIR